MTCLDNEGNPCCWRFAKDSRDLWCNECMQAEIDRLRGIVGGLYAARGEDANGLRGRIRRAFRDIQSRGVAT